MFLHQANTERWCVHGLWLKASACFKQNACVKSSVRNPFHLSNVSIRGGYIQQFLCLSKTYNLSRPLHATFGRVCRDEKVCSIWTSLNSLFFFYKCVQRPWTLLRKRCAPFCPSCTIYGISPLSRTAGFLPHLRVWPVGTYSNDSSVEAYWTL